MSIETQFKPGMAGESIMNLHRRLALLGIEVPAAEREEDRFGPGTEAAIRQFQATNGLASNGVVDEATARGLGLGGHPSSIAGLVCRPDGTPLGDVAVRLYQQGAGETVIADTRSDDDGKFSLPWPAGIAGGLTVRADGGSGKSVSWKTANSSGTAWVRLTIGGEYRGATRFSALSRALAPAVEARAFHAIGGAGRAPELKAIGEAARVPGTEVSRHVLAHKLAARTQLDPSVFFALLTHHVTPEMRSLLDPTAGDADSLDDGHVDQVLDLTLRQHRDDVRAALEAAIAGNIVADLDIDAAAAQLHELRIEHIAAQPLTWSLPLATSDEHPCCAICAEPSSLTSDGDGDADPAPVRVAARPLHVHRAPLRDVLATSVTDPATQRRVLEAFAAKDGNARLGSVVDDVAGLSPERRADLRFTLEAAALLGNHLPLVKRVQKLRATGKIARTSDLARFDEADWADLLRKADPNAQHIALPAGARLAAAPADDRIDHFARALARQLELAHPTTALSGRLAKDRGELPLTATPQVQRFLDRAPSFCVRHSHIDRFVNDLGAETLPSGEDDRTEVISDLKTLQRAYKLTPRFGHVKAMLAAGHRSAYSIYATGPEQFAAQMTAAGMAPGEASAIFSQAEQVHATTLTLMGNLNSAFMSATPAAVAEPLAMAVIQAALANFPTVQSLFGAVDYCACADCRSIHGPAAYLVDILQFLKARPATGGFSFVREVLLARRPDIGQIELSCANTNGVVPYIDLVCEILEDAVATPVSGAVRARQTSGTTEELRANPAFINDAAYTTLRNAVFPVTAPFDLFAAEVRAYFRQLGVPWHELLAAWQVSGAPSDAQIAGERFGFNASALNIVTNAAPSAPWTLWNLAETTNTVPDPRKPDDATANKTGTWLQILAFVPILLDRAKLQHRELIQLLETRFINPGGVLTIIEAPSANGFATCDTGQQTVAGWTADLLTRLNRFIRLWRQLGCTIWDLDKVLCTATVGNTLIDANAIAQVGRVHAVAARLGGPWDELLTLWGNIDRFNYINVLDEAEPIVPSVYRRRFRNTAVTQSAPVFVDDPNTLTGTLDVADTIAGISAALDISADDIQRIRAATALPSGTALNLTNLSVIARHAFLADKLHLSISDLLTAIVVTGVNPFPNPLSPTATLQFVAAFDQVQSSGFTLLELSYLLRHGSVIDSKIGLTDATIISWLEDLRRALVRLGATGAAAADLVVQRISAMIPLDPALTRQVLQATLPGGSSTMAALFAASSLTARASDGSFTTATTRANFAAIFDAYTALDKMRIVLARWRVSTADALWLLQHAAGAGWMELHTLPASAAAAQSSTVTFARLEILRSNVVVQQTLASPGGVRLFDFVLSPGATVAEAVAKVAQLGGWLDSDIAAVVNRLGLSTPASLVADAMVARIRDLMAWPRKLGANVPTTLTFVTTTVALPEARKARQLAKSRFTNDEWLGVSAAIQDRLREQKRAALVGWLLANPNASRNQKWVTVEDLYGFYLIDPEMSAVATTTRIKQAAASVQLFVQRCLLQLEPNVSVNVDSDSVWKQWDWMKRFRLWEANRKIFLYPENWFDPTQRRDMSPYFADLVNDLQQTDLTNDLAENALRAYLHKLTDVSHLEVSGLWEEIQGGQSTLHVVARTRKTPYVYSYRRREPTGFWSPWEPLDAGVDTSHVMPAIWNKRLFMLWTEFTEKSLPTSAADRTVPAAGTTPTTAEPTKYWEIALAWLERRNNIWLPKRLSQRKQVITTWPKREVVFRAATPQRNLAIELYQPTKSTGIPTPLQAQWMLTSPQDEPVLMTTDLNTLSVLEEMRYIGPVTGGNGKMGAKPKLAGVDMTFHFNAYGGDTGGVGVLGLQKLDGMGNLAIRTMVSNISRARVISVRFGETDQFQSPFFVSDPQRTFFVPNGNWTLQTFYHPFVETFVQRLNIAGVPGLYDRTLQTNPDSLRGTTPFDFAATYTPSSNVLTPFPTETIDYTPSGPYSVYNWELFLHTPLLIAKRLADNRRFEEALRWLHYIFNPTTVSGGNAPQRFWNLRVFRDLTSTDYTQQQIEQLLQLVNQNNSDLVQRVNDWRNNPFDPNLVAAARPVAYQKAVVMQYISTLVAWGDQLFRGDTIESINEATQLYLLASQLLGPRPQSLRAIQPRQNQTYGELASALDTFSNRMVDIENVVSVPPPGVTAGTVMPTLHTFYFCIPPNDQMLAYWDIVADRLFKVRHGLNLDGIARPLALYEPPIDPGLLVRAAAAGVDISAAIGDSAVDLMCYRFTTLWQVAHDLCQDVRGLGSAILSALERRDGEEMSRLRATQEVAVLDAVRTVKTKQLEEANANRVALERSREMAVMRRDFYASREFMNAAEAQGQKLVNDALDLELAGVVLDIISAAAALIPALQAGASGFGGSPVVTALFGGENLSRNAGAAAGVLRGFAGMKSQRAGLSNTLASYQRRRDDWDLQRRLAEKEIDQIDRQLIAADIRIAIAAQELGVQLRQIEDAKVNAELLQSKFTNKELYDWMLSQLSSTYFHAYELAYDLAKRATRAYSFELGAPDPGFIQFGYFDSLHKGLVAGDKLLLDLRRLQNEHLNRNKRDLELTKHVSLLQLDPGALITLRQTGECFFNLPETLFDLDQPGHYFRRLKTVSVTLPCVTGPYTTINATLTLQSHTTRISTAVGGGYLATLDTDGLPSASDTRFSHGTGAVQSIALSTGREDAGMFEVNFHDERYLPFEGLGALSRWRLELPKDTNRFDLSTLSDVVMHVRYTARDGGQALRDAARAAVITPLPRNGFQLLSARSEFPDAFARLFGPTGTGQRLDLALGADHFPFLPTTQQINLTSVSAVLLFTADRTYADYLGVAAGERLKARLGFTPDDGTPPATSTTFTAVAATLGGVPIAPASVAGPVGPVTLAFLESEIALAPLLDKVETVDGTPHPRLDPDKIDDILILVSYQIAART